ncbi:hypothetical protein PybrP1_004411 [[Pythium] brassicae (nom. inval.)]|nr:hypothetical protein PybrP1_004411 [[Pythium] brassicae (nom. inval.)]
MSEREQQLALECRQLKSEVVALEALVVRYQDELSAAGYSPVPAHLRPRVVRVEEQLFEHQRLNAPHSKQLSSTCTRVSGEPCAFGEVALPSADWEWVSDWRVDISTCTDEHGWRYAAASDQFDDDENPPRREKSLEDRVRRRRWTRERMLLNASGLPAVLNRRLQEESRAAAMVHTNEKLTQQLLHANERLVEFEDRAQQYEAQLLRLQDIVHRLSRKSGRQSLSRPARAPSRLASPRFSTSSKNNADVLSQTEALLDQILSSPGLANLDLATTIAAEERRSFMVEACQQELQDAVNEFHDLVGKAGTPPPELRPSESEGDASER